MNRRSFLLLLGGATGLALGQQLLELPRRLVVSLGGRCSFCWRPASERRRMAGITARDLRICGECIALCVEFLAESDLPVGPRERPSPFDAPEISLPTGSEEEILEHLERLLVQPSSRGSVPAGPTASRRWFSSPFTEPVPSFTVPVRSRDGTTREGRVWLAPDRAGWDRPPRPRLACSFCDAEQRTVRKLIAGPAVYVCEACVGDAATILGAWRHV